MSVDETNAIERVLALLDFLEAYDARRNPPVYAVEQYELYRLAAADLPSLPGVTLTSGADAWLAVDFVELPARPAVPTDLVDLLGADDALTAHRAPELSDESPEVPL